MTRSKVIIVHFKNVYVRRIKKLLLRWKNEEELNG